MENSGKKYQIDTEENKMFLGELQKNLLNFGKGFLSPGGSAYFLGDDGTPWKDRNRETWITCRLVHVYSMGIMLGDKESPALVHGAVHGLLEELKDRENGGWYPGITPDNKFLPDKQCYAHAFVLLAASSALLAGEKDAETLLKDALELFDKRFWDEKQGLTYDTWNTEFTVLDDYRGLNANMHTVEAFLADGDENEITVTKKGCYVKNLNYEDYIALGKLTEKEEELLREVMSEEFRNEIPSFGVGSDVANLALTKVGCKYSQEHRYEEGYYDCSSLVQRLYQEVGISLPAIASTQGEFMVTHGLEVTEGELEPGDLIFYSYEQNGQFRNISHVAIYVGNGRMVHAANSRRGVVNDPFNPSNIGLYGRPSRLQ